jgi:hypothetical protein
MSDHIPAQAEEYRQRAGEVRATARVTRDLLEREHLEKLARGYERLADYLERAAATCSREGDAN